MNRDFFASACYRATLKRFALASIFVLAGVTSDLTRTMNAQSPIDLPSPVTRTIEPGDHHRYTIPLDADV
jgi:hypothetical protein